MPDETIEEDTAKEVQEDITESDEDVTWWMRVGAGAQLAILFLAIIAAAIASVYFGFVTPSIAISATINIGWFVEYAIIAVIGTLVMYIFALVLIVLPGSILNGLAGIAYGVAVAAGFVETEQNNENE